MTPTNTANTVSLITDAGTTYYFYNGTGKRVAYNGSNTPWTSAGTSCLVLALNETAGPIYIPQPAHAQMVYGGGPPFTNGQRPQYQSFGNVTESVGLQIYANNKDNAIFLLQLLRRILNTALFSVPCTFGVKSGTNTGYAEIYSADIDESHLYLVEPDGIWRTTITWNRSPFFGALATGETVFTSRTFTNTNGGGSPNFQAFPIGPSGDLIYLGQPLNIKIEGTGSGDPYRVYMASAYSQEVFSVNATYTTNSTSGVAVNNTNYNVAALLTHAALRPRVLLRAGSPTANLEVRIVVSLDGTTGTGQTIYTSPWIDPPNVSTLIDFGTWPMAMLRRIPGVTTSIVTVTTWYRSTNGSNASALFDYAEFLLYYDFCRIDAQVLTALGSQYLQVAAFPESANTACLPYLNPLTYVIMASSLNVYSTADVRGRLPRLYDGASLYLAWMDNTFLHTKTWNASITARHAPLWHTARGAD